MPSQFRPLYHFSPPQGWINDPNGLVYLNGLWHLFYQHMPTVTDAMHWGHAISRDLTRWEHRPVALAPDELGSIWSGSAAVLPGGEPGQSRELVACFTHSSKLGQSQGLAFSSDEGDTWEKYQNNPVLTSERPDFRDPKIFQHHGRWIMIVAAGFEAQIYASLELVHWELLSSFPAPREDWVWECPDLFELDGRWVCLASFVRPGAAVDDQHGSYYWIGQFNGTRFSPQTGISPLSFGPDDYAAVSWSHAPDNRRVVIGWMSKWTYASATPTADEGWRGAMTLPRDLTLQGDLLLQTPSPEVLQRRGKEIRFDENFLDFAGDAYEIEAEIDISHLRQTQVGFRLRVGDGEATRVFYDSVARELFIDRTRSGLADFHPAFAARFHQHLEILNNILKLNIFVDRCSVEVFAQDGELYAAMLVFPSSASLGVEFFGLGARISRGSIYPYSCGES